MKITVNNDVVDEKQIEDHIKQLTVQHPHKPKEEIEKAAANQLIQETLLKQAARNKYGEVSEQAVDQQFNRYKSQFPSEAEFQAMCARNKINEYQMREDIRDQMRVNMLTKEIIGNVPPISEKTLREHYRKNPKASTKPKEVHAAHIVKRPHPRNPVKTYQQMIDVRARLLDGANFAEMANKLSECHDKDGDLGYFSPGKMVEEFDAVVFSMNPDEISPVFKTEFGYHIATVYDIRPEEKLSFEKCRKQIESELKDRHANEAIHRWFQKARNQADVTIEK